MSDSEGEEPAEPGAQEEQEEQEAQEEQEEQEAGRPEEALADDELTSQAKCDRRIKMLRGQLREANEDLTRLRQCNAHLFFMLKEHNIPLPPDLQGAGEMAAERHVPALNDSRARTVEADDPFPFAMRQLHLADTLTVTEPKRFSSDNGPVWPSVLGHYGRGKEGLVPINERCRQQWLEFQLVDLRDKNRVVTEHDLLDALRLLTADTRLPADADNVAFRLRLLFADSETDEDVTMEALDQRRAASVSELLTPSSVLAKPKTLRDGKVLWVIREQNALSSMTLTHRQFVWLLECVDERFDTEMRQKLKFRTRAYYQKGKDDVKQGEGARAGKGGKKRARDAASDSGDGSAAGSPSAAAARGGRC